MNEQDPIHRIGQEARVLIEARMLPLTKLTHEEIGRVREHFKTYIKLHGIFGTAVAKRLGVSDSVISQWANGVYTGDTEAVTRKVNDWFELDARTRLQKGKASKAGDGFPGITTKTIEEMRGIILAAIADACMAAIIAPSGTGKTMLLQHCAEKYSGFYFKCQPSMSEKAFLAAIADVVGASTGKRSKAQVYKEIVLSLKGRGPLFLDEVHLLPPQIFNIIRSIFDDAGVPIIMAGTDLILAYVNDRANGRGQFASRCIQYIVTEVVANAQGGPGGQREGRPLFTRQEIAEFLELQNVKLSDDAAQMAWGISCLPDHGCWRFLRRVLRMLRPNASTPGAEIELKEFNGMVKRLLGNQGSHLITLGQRQVELMSEAA